MMVEFLFKKNQTIDPTESILYRLNKIENKCDSLESENTELRNENIQLKEKVRVREKRLLQNSHLPPSIDSVKAKNSIRKSTRAKAGGQQKHNGKILETFKEVTEIFECPALQC